MLPLIWTFISSKGSVSNVGFDWDPWATSADEYRLPMSIFIGYLNAGHEFVDLYWIPSENSYAVYEPKDPDVVEMVVRVFDGFEKFENALKGFFRFNGMLCGCHHTGPFIVDTDGSMRENRGLDFGVISCGYWIYQQRTKSSVLTGSFVSPISMQGATTSELLAIAIVLYLLTRLTCHGSPVVIRTDSLNSVKYIHGGRVGKEGEKLGPLIDVCRGLKESLERDGMVISVQHIPNVHDGKPICKERNNAHYLAFQAGRSLFDYFKERDNADYFADEPNAEMPRVATLATFAKRELSLPRLILDALQRCEEIYCSQTGAIPYFAQQ